MAEQRKKSHSILLRTECKMFSVELFSASEWSEECSSEGLYRVRVNDVWHCPTGKYSFLPLVAIGELVAAFLNNGETTKGAPAPYLPYKAEVKVYSDGVSFTTRGFVHAPPHQERDGRWYVWIWIPGGPRKFLADEVVLKRVR